tara:strand:+ start:1600 stop:2235 length:636 start_codon:yes stop_codon:yes gene_type:complete
MECENNIINNDNKYTINNKVLYKTKFKCNSNEPIELRGYKHQNLFLSFDFNNYIISEYINNNIDLGLLDLYKTYVENFHKALTDFKKNNKDNTNNFYTSIDYLENQEEIYYLEEQIKNLIISLCYLRINDYIKKTYNTDKNYFIFNFKLDIKFVDDLCKYIYFNHYIDNNDFYLNHNHILAIGYFVTKERIYHNIKKIAYVQVSGDIYYKN